MDATAAGNIEGLANIKKVVVLMFENRSFDHIFGAFPGANGLMADGKINPEYYNLPDPLNPPSSDTNAKVYPIPVDPTKPLNRDFTHDFGDGAMPDLFGPIFITEPPNAVPTDTGARYYSGYAEGSPLYQANPGRPTYPKTNPGFYSTYQSDTPQGQSVLTYFEHNALKVLPTLAENFVLCDNWYCDMPGHTLPNRAFIHCGTTGAAGIDDIDDKYHNVVVGAPTIFDRIDEVGPGNWKMYVQATEAMEEYKGHQTEVAAVAPTDMRFLTKEGSNYKGVPITEFRIDCEAGTLPFYSFIMCWLPSATAWTDTSMHPGSMLQGGENLLAAVYNTLRRSPSWEETLLVVTFDENGGIYDHVLPPNTTPPDNRGIVSAPPSDGDCNNSWQLMSQFDFSLLGPRVPALLISPWLNAGIDSHQYQNTSVLRFLIDRLNSQSSANVSYLTERDANAPPLDSAFGQFGTDTMRDDCPDWIASYAKLPSIDPHTGSDAIPYSDGKLGIWQAPPGTKVSPPPCFTQEVLGTYVRPLPGHADSGKPITRTFATNAEVASYVRERVEAAERVQHASRSVT